MAVLFFGEAFDILNVYSKYRLLLTSFLVAPVGLGLFLLMIKNRWKMPLRQCMAWI